MNDITKFIRARHIDSFQKLRLLAFLYQHPESSWTSQEIAEKLCLGDVPLLERIMADLRSAGLVDCVGKSYTLHNEPGVRSSLQRLDEVCEDPLARQQILDQVTRGTFVTDHYLA
ncbi:MAG: hypothetical protein Kow0063_07750 [Anaerolineae bacterium]